jgi:3-hydroxyisobutyrate dehydrogenase-like beta-hydroxyacid dehydrogenase
MIKCQMPRTDPGTEDTARHAGGLESVAVIGTGLIGRPLAVRLKRAGYEVVAWNRTKAKALELRDSGIAVVETPARAVAPAHVVALTTFDDEALDAVLRGPEGVLAGLRPDTLVIDFSTTGIAAKLRFAELVRARGGRPAEAPFFGTVPNLEGDGIWPVTGTAPADADEVEAFCSPFSASVHRAGEVGDATRFKLAANLLTFAMVNNIAEALALGRALGVDVEGLLDAIRDGTGVRAPIYQAKGRAMLRGDFAPQATVDLARKDLRHILAAATEHGVTLRSSQATLEVFDATARAGFADEDMSAVYKLIARDAGP